MDNFQNGKKPVYFDNTEICIMRILSFESKMNKSTPQ